MLNRLRKFLKIAMIVVLIVVAIILCFFGCAWMVGSSAGWANALLAGAEAAMDAATTTGLSAAWGAVADMSMGWAILAFAGGVLAAHWITSLICIAALTVGYYYTDHHNSAGKRRRSSSASSHHERDTEGVAVVDKTSHGVTSSKQPDEPNPNPKDSTDWLLPVIGVGLCIVGLSGQQQKGPVE